MFEILFKDNIAVAVYQVWGKLCWLQNYKYNCSNIAIQMSLWIQYESRRLSAHFRLGFAE
jgi:hypothetical protein